MFPVTRSQKLYLFRHTKTSNLVVLYDLRDLTRNISSIMTKHLGYIIGCTALLISLAKVFYAINHNLLMLFSRSILVPCHQHQFKTKLSKWTSNLLRSVAFPSFQHCQPTCYLMKIEYRVHICQIWTWLNGSKGNFAQSKISLTEKFTNRDGGTKPIFSFPFFPNCSE